MHLLVVANETVTGRKLIEAVERREGGARPPGDGHRSGQPASTRLRRLRGHASGGGRADGSTGRSTLLRDAGHPRARARRGERSGDGGSRCARAARAAGGRDHPRDAPAATVRLAPQERRGPDSRNRRCRSGRARRRRLDGRDGRQNVLVLANETVVGKALARPNTRARCPRQCELPDHLSAERSDSRPSTRGGAATEASPGRAARRGDRRARPDSAHRTRSRLRSMRFGEERVDEIIVSTFAPSRSPWLRKNLVAAPARRDEAAGRARRLSV